MKREQVQEAVVRAIFRSSESMLETIRLKGGVALNLVYGLNRSSYDLDFSVVGELNDGQKGELIKSLKVEFKSWGLIAFDFKYERKPKPEVNSLQLFWGGSQLCFKLIEPHRFQDSLEEDRRNSLVLGPKGTISIDFSFHEFAPHEQLEYASFNDVAISVYSPALIVCEKLRAICQQSSEYNAIVKRSRIISGRARDFIDIYALRRRYPFTASNESSSLLRNVMDAKRVPWDLLLLIPKYYTLHSSDYLSETRRYEDPTFPIHFDSYFNEVVLLAQSLHAFGHK